MSLNKHLNILDFTISSLLRRRLRNSAIVLVFTFIIFIAASVLLLTYSFKREAMLILESSPELIIQKMSAGRHELIPVGLVSDIRAIPGVADVQPRFWGYYYDSLTKANYTVLALAADSPVPGKVLNGMMPDNGDDMIAVGKSLAAVRFIDTGSDITLQSASGKPISFRVSGVFKADSELLTADLIVMSKTGFLKLFDTPEGMATDLAVRVNNVTEAPVIARKIRERFPFTRPILRAEIIRTYDAVFGWRSGMILTLFAGALAAFIILAWDKASGLSAEEKKEIGILKAIGWETSDVLEMKFWEGFVISVSSALLGLILAYIHVFFFGASIFGPALKGWSVIYPDFRLAPFINPYQIATVITLTVVPYIASTIIPSWKAAITDPDEIVRG